MVSVTAYSYIDMREDRMMPVGDPTLVYQSSTALKYTFPTGQSVVVNGVFGATSGVIQSMYVYNASNEIDGTFTGLRILLSGSDTPNTIATKTAFSTILSGNDFFTGGPGNDYIMGYGGNDALNGSTGTDTALYAGPRSQYTVTRGNGSVTVSGPEGTDSLANIERVRFADGTLGLESADAPGKALRLYRAALGREPDAAGLGFQTSALDGGWSLASVATNFIASPEFQQKYGAQGQALETFVGLLYQNVLGRAGGASEVAYHVNRLNSGVSRENVLIGFSESPENVANTASLTANGIWFT